MLLSDSQGNFHALAQSFEPLSRATRDYAIVDSTGDGRLDLVGISYGENRYN